jgi:hypothetical protein
VPPITVKGHRRIVLERVVIDEQECLLCPIREGLLCMLLNPYDNPQIVKWQRRTRWSSEEIGGLLGDKERGVEARKVDLQV